MAAALNAFMKIAIDPEGKSFAKGESKQSGYEEWIELQSWEWEIEAESSWTKGSGASVGKAVPGKMNWEHYWDKSSNTLLKYICGGNSFPLIQLHMCKATGGEKPEPYWTATMTGAFITKVNQSATEEGNVAQKVEMVFKTIDFDYKPQGMAARGSGLGSSVTAGWNIETGKVT